MKAGFLDKLVERLDRLDPESLQRQFMRLIQERGLLETIFQSIQEGVIVIDGDGRMTYANRAAEKLIGFSLSESRGRHISRALEEIDWNRILELKKSEWARVISREIEITYPEHRFVSFYAVPLAMETENGDGAVVILRDVTGAREQEESMLESERLNAVKLLAAGVAHEIGNPLNALNIHLQLLDREIRQLPEAEQGTLSELTAVAGAEVQRLDRIISQFLKAVRPTQPKLAPAQVEALLNDTLVLIREEVENRNIEVRIERPDTLPELQLDGGQMKQVFFNLTKNAIEAMPDGGALRITLSVDDEAVGIAFEDTGEGIQPEDFGRLFEPYQTTKSEGTGLGLMIVQRIIQDHGGQIEVASKPGMGTCFTVRLPLVNRRVRLLGKVGGTGVKPSRIPVGESIDVEDAASEMRNE